MLSRRRFLNYVIKGAVLGNFADLIAPQLREVIALQEIKNKLPVVMIESGTCTGDSISLENIWTPSFSDILTNLTEWRYDWNLQQSQGRPSYQVLLDTAEKMPYEYVLIVQGAMQQADNGNFCHVALEDNRLVTALELVRRIGLKAKYVVAIGTCATYGGPVAGYPNPTQATGVQSILPEKAVINVSGCPAHPDWIMGTLLHLALFGKPELEKFGRPKMFYGETIHNNCPRRRYYDQGIFATNIGQPECLYRVGCKGPVTYADCPIRRWNDRYNWPIGCNSPCIGCTEPGFPDLMEPFTSHSPDLPLPGGTKATADKIGLAVIGTTSLGITAHFLTSLAKGRIRKNLLRSTRRVSHKIALRRNRGSASSVFFPATKQKKQTDK